MQVTFGTTIFLYPYLEHIGCHFSHYSPLVASFGWAYLSLILSKISDQCRDGFMASLNGSADWIGEDLAIDFKALYVEFNLLPIGGNIYGVMLYHPADLGMGPPSYRKSWL